MKVCFEIGGNDCHCGGRLVPVLGLARDTVGPVEKTPQFQRFPLLGELIMAVTMDTAQQCPVSIVVVDRKGKPVGTDGPPTWLASNTDVVALTPSADGLSCTVVAVGIPGTATVQVTADADLGSGVVNLVGTIDFEITPTQGTAIQITAGTPVDQA